MDLSPAPAFSAPSITANLRMIFCALQAALGAWGFAPLQAKAIYRRISETLSRIERMLVRFRAGRLWRGTRRVAVPGRKLCETQAIQLPRNFGWLVQAGKQEAACIGSQFQTVLNTPEMMELLASSAQARRLLRPLCRALAVELPWVRGVLHAVSTESGEIVRFCRKRRAKPEPFRIPLPPGVLTAARRQGLGKMC